MSLNAIFDPMVRSYFDDDDSGGGLPVVELTTVVTAENSILTAEEIAKFEAVGSHPCIVKCNLSYMGTELPCELVCHSMSFADTKLYAAVFSTGDATTWHFDVNNMDGVWKACFTVP